MQPATTITGTSASSLSGNWLLAGALPFSGGQLSGTSITATFDVIGGNVTGIVEVFASCTTSSTTASTIAPLVVSGAVAADGSFTLTSATVSGVSSTASITLQGVVPTSAAGPWSGTYNLTVLGNSCSSGKITATAISPVTGTYSGSIALNNQYSSLSQLVPAKISLQQGGYPVVPGSTSPLYSNLFLSGTITLSNSSCVTSGTTTGASIQSFVEGSTVVANFVMNDGSTAFMVGQITTQDASSLSVELNTITPGTCAQLFFTSPSFPVTMTR